MMNFDPLFTLAGIPVHTLDLVWLGIGFLVLSGLFFAFSTWFIPKLEHRESFSRSTKRKGQLLFGTLSLLLFIELSIRILDIQIMLFGRIGIHLVVEALILLVLIFLILWIATYAYIHRYFENREKDIPALEAPLREKNTEKTAIKTLRWLLFLIAILILLRYIEWDYTLWTIRSPKENDPDVLIRISSMLVTIIFFIVARLFLWVLTQLLLYGYYKRRQFDPGISYSINRLITYLVYLFTLFIALRNLGMNLGLLLGGAAALLVGVGLALQATFSDFFSGLVLLFERPFKVGDFVGYEGKPVEVQKIGLRASKVIDRNHINYIIPNSKLITQPVINWSHDEKYVRFQVTVGVAYGSDTALVEKLLLQAASEHRDVLKRPKPKVVFSDFGSSSLDFQLNYYSKNIFNAEWVKSDLRFAIDKLFRENHITIPFPQRDVWFKNT